MLILAYHRVNPEAKDNLSVSPETLEDQLMHLSSRGWKNVVLEDVVSDGDLARHSRSFAVTFDDGYQDNFTHALPVLQRLDMRATIYVSTAFVDSGEVFPWVTNSHAPQDVNEDDQPLTWDQLKEMMSEGVFTVGSHTLNHPLLSGLQSEAAYQEIYESKGIIESRLGVDVTTFCYPAGDFNQETVGLVQQSGYSAAVVTPNRHIPETPLTLHRIGVYRSTTPFMFNLKTQRLVSRAQKSAFRWWLTSKARKMRR